MTELPYRVFDINDSIDFGQMKHEPFKWIYLLATPYLTWLIEETNVCFADLSLFYQFGQPFRLAEQSLTEVQKKQIHALVRKIGKNNYKKGSAKSYLLTVEIFSKMIELQIVKPNAFTKINFEFSEKSIEKNTEKLNSAIANVLDRNIKRDEYLSHLFNI